MARMGDRKVDTGFWWGRPVGKRPLGVVGSIILIVLRWGAMHWIELA